MTDPSQSAATRADRRTVEPVAIVGMACRVPGAADTDQFWRDLVAGVDSIRRFDRDEQAALGVPASELDDPDSVPAAPVLDDDFLELGGDSLCSAVTV